MQKKLIALAVVAAFSAPAFADVTAYGVVDAALVRASADGLKSDMQAVSGGLSTSRFGVKTVEDLNNGMKAVVVLEYGLDSETNSSVGADNSILTAGFKARQQMLAIAGDFGTFATGYLQTTGYDWAVKFDPTAGSSVSPLQSMTATTAVIGSGISTNLVGSKTLGARAQRALAYISPDLGGVTVAVNYSTDLGVLTGPGGLGNLGQPSAGADTKVTAMLVSATYTGGPLSVGGVYVKDSLPSALSALEMKEYALGGSYDLGVVKLFATYQNNKMDLGSFSSKVYSASAVAPVGPGAVLFSYAKNKTSIFGASGGASGYTAGYLQGLSKLTTAYVTYSKVSNNTNSIGASVDNNVFQAASLGSNNSSTMIAVGLNKKF
jgi:predicted porin